MRAGFNELDGNDAYELLGVRPDASPDQIQRAWRGLATAHHPDRVTDPSAKAEAEERLRLLNAARDVLLNHRASYDDARRAPEPSHEEIIEDPSDIEDPWDMATAGARRPGPRTTTVPGPPPPARVRHIHHYHPSVPRRGGGSKAGIGCVLVVLTGLALLLGIAALVAMQPDEPASETVVPRDLAGTWTGNVKDHYGGRATWAVELTLKAGEKSGEVRYLHGKCIGTAVPVSHSGNSLVLRTNFTAGLSGCDVGDITLTRRKDGKADIVYYAADQRTKKTTGVLRHRD